MQIIGHRGARGLAPMNTVASIKAALQAGVDWIEFDVRRTKDGVIVLSHDKTTRKMAVWPRRISRTRYATLAKAKTYRGEPIATITEAFKAIGAKAKINVEIKSKGCAGIVTDHIERMVKAGANYDRFLVSSFKTERLREIHRLNDHVPLGLLHYFQPFTFLKLRALRLSAVGFWRKRLPKKAITQAKVRGLTVFVYTVNDKRRAAQLAARGVDGIVTDRPDVLQELRG
jgi:glycerophosphoryl diester phosphodiesterase